MLNGKQRKLEGGVGDWELTESFLGAPRLGPYHAERVLDLVGYLLLLVEKVFRPGSLA